MVEPLRGRTDKAHWLDALRNYPKATGVLCQLNSVGYQSFCCLGVLAAEDGVLKVIDSDDVRFLAPDTDDEGDVLGYVWRDPSEAEEVYLGHPKLTHHVQSLLTRANDCTQTFDAVVIPLIEHLLADDLSLKPEHKFNNIQDSEIGMFIASQIELDRIHYFHLLVAALADGLPFVAAHERARDQINKVKEATDG